MSAIRFLITENKKGEDKGLFDKLIVRALSRIAFAGSPHHRFDEESF